MKPSYCIALLAFVTSALAWMCDAFSSREFGEGKIGLEMAEELLAMKGLGSIVFDSQKTPIANLTRTGHLWTPIQEIPEVVIQAFVGVEDCQFYEHGGFSVTGLVRAAWFNLSTFSVSQGASTITQQLVRSHYLSREKSFTRKLREIVLARMLERHLTKDQILEIYLNTIFLGNHSYGVRSAARNYFGKTLASLNVAEATMLAGLPQAPSLYNPVKNFERARKRHRIAIEQMINCGVRKYGSSEEIYRKDIRLKLQRSTRLNQQAQYFVSYLRRSNPEEFRRWESDPRTEIWSTYDSRLVRDINQLAKRTFAAELRKQIDFDVAFAVVEGDTGRILALSGGLDFNKSQYNRAVDLTVPWGSKAFGVFGLLHFLEQARTGDTDLLKNWLSLSEVDLGRVLERPIYAISKNSVLDRIFNNSHLAEGGLALQRLSPLSMAHGFSIFGTGGRICPLLAIDSLSVNGGFVQKSQRCREESVVDPFHAFGVRFLIQSFGKRDRARTVTPEVLFGSASTDRTAYLEFGIGANIGFAMWAGIDGGGKLISRIEDYDRRRMERFRMSLAEVFRKHQLWGKPDISIDGKFEGIGFSRGSLGAGEFVYPVRITSRLYSNKQVRF